MSTMEHTQSNRTSSQTESGHSDGSSERSYIAIDLKSFYASVECVERSLNPMTTNLVVADPSRTEKTICLAVSPSLKAYGIPGRPRLFEVVQKVKELNNSRRYYAPAKTFRSSSIQSYELQQDPSLEIDYVTAPPRMQLYMDYSTRIYEIYLKYIAPEDIHAYSVDEVFIDATTYLHTYQMTAHELAKTMIYDILNTTGITATAGIGTNLYLCKVAMDIVAKHMPADKEGVRIAELNERTYRELLWDHTPLIDFWRVGPGYSRKLNQNGMYTMGDIARRSLVDEDRLYKLFGVNAELLIDHAWGWEPCTIAEIKSYKPENNSLSSGQVLQEPYTNSKARIIIREMTESLALDLVSKGLVTDQVILTVGYDIDNLKNPEIASQYQGEIHMDRYGRAVPKHAHGSSNLTLPTSSARLMIDAVLSIYDRVTDPKLLIRRMTVAANHVVYERDLPKQEFIYEQMDLFTDYSQKEQEQKELQEELEKERSIQQAMLHIKKKYGKNAIFKGTDLQEGATALERNRQIGGHKA